MDIPVIDIVEKMEQVDEFWTPHIVAELNGQQVRVAKLQGEFDWHHHENEDELFWVIRGRLVIELRDGIIELGPGQMAVVPRGVPHRPVATELVEVVLFEPATTLNTGNVENERTKRDLNRI